MINFIKLENLELENQFTELVKTERKITYEVLLYIQEIDRRSLHLSLGYSNLADYLIKRHSYSEGSAFRRISAMRMLRSVPEIKEKIINGQLNLTQLSMVQLAVSKKQRQDNIKFSDHKKRELLLKIEGQSKAKTQSKIADNLNVDFQEKRQITFGKEESVYLNFKFTKKEYEILRECLSLMSHQAKDYKELLLLLSEKTIKRIAWVQKKSTRATRVIQSHSRNIPNAIKREVFLRDGSRCQFKSKEGIVCGSQNRLQVHHIKAFANGGTHSIQNLSLRCQAHNLYEAEIEGLIG